MTLAQLLPPNVLVASLILVGLGAYLRSKNAERVPITNWVVMGMTSWAFTLGNLNFSDAPRWVRLVGFGSVFLSGPCISWIAQCPRTSNKHATIGLLLQATGCVAVALFTQNLIVMTLAFAALVGLLPKLVALQCSTGTPEANADSDRARWTCLASVICVGLASVILMAITRSMTLSEIQAGLQASFRPEHALAPASSGFAYWCGHAAVVLLFVGVSAMGLSAPAPFLGLDLCDAWPGVVAGWWLMLSRAMCLAVVWRVGVATLVGLESACVLTALAIGSLSLLIGAAGLWHRDALRSVVGRLLLIHGGLSWLAVAAMSAKPTGDATTISLGGLPVGVDLAALLWAVSSVALLVIFATEQALTLGRERLEFVEEFAGLGRTRTLAAASLSAGLLSLTVIPPLPGFWCGAGLLGAAFLPGTPTFAHATLLPHPAVLWMSVLALLALLVASGRVLGIVARMTGDEPLGSVRLSLASWKPPCPDVLILFVALMLAGVLLSVGCWPGLLSLI